MPFSSASVGAILADADAVRTGGHYVYNSGKHGPDYVNKDMITLRPEVCYLLGREIARRVVGSGLKIDVVVAPAYGAISPGSAAAYHVSLTLRGKGDIFFLFAMKKGEEFEFRPALEKYLKGKRVLIVEDILTTGGSAKKVVDLVRSKGGDPVCVAVLVNRGGVKAEDVGVPAIEALVDIEMPMYEPGKGACPLCDAGVPVNTDLGHGAKYLEELERIRAEAETTRS